VVGLSGIRALELERAWPIQDGPSSPISTEHMLSSVCDLAT
jgi:hypothetical protein